MEFPNLNTHKPPPPPNLALFAESIHLFIIHWPHNIIVCFILFEGSTQPIHFLSNKHSGIEHINYPLDLLVYTFCKNCAPHPHCRLPADESEGGPYYKSGSGVLVLTNAQTGLYTCTGVNELGSSSATTVITVTSTPGG